MRKTRPTLPVGAPPFLDLASASSCRLSPQDGPPRVPAVTDVGPLELRLPQESPSTCLLTDWTGEERD